nr:MAG TPA: hypothetical protein [Caudoviricetes sp.]
MLFKPSLLMSTSCAGLRSAPFPYPSRWKSWETNM